MMNLQWHRRYIQMAGLVSTWSKDPSTQVGCVLVNPESQVVVSTGFNGMPRGIDEYQRKRVIEQHGRSSYEKDGLSPRWYGRPEKYQWVEHAERNAIYNAARFGQATLGCVAYMNYDPRCLCTDCARAIVQAGITQVIGPNRKFPGKGAQWVQDLIIAELVLQEAGVRAVVVADAR